MLQWLEIHVRVQGWGLHSTGSGQGPSVDSSENINDHLGPMQDVENDIHRGDKSLGTTWAQPHSIFETKKQGQLILEKQFVSYIYHLYKEGSSHKKSTPEIYRACFNMCDNENQENIGTALCEDS
jgi:hypothetical protein